MFVKKSSSKQNISFGDISPVFGSMTKIHGKGCVIIHPKTGEHIRNVLLEQDIQQKIQEEKDAVKIIFSLRDRCVRPNKYNPSDEELRAALDALRVLWFMLPKIQRHPGEKNKTFFLRTLHEVGRFRGVDMFFGSKE